VSDSPDRRAGVWRLAVPALGALVAEPLFLLADTAIVGRLGTGPLAALGVAAGLLASAVNLFVFLAYATTAAVARRLGADDRPGALAQGVDGMWLAAGLGTGVALLGWPLAGPLVALFGPAPPVAVMAVTYLRWSLPGLPAMLLVLAATGVLRGLPDTRTPLLVAGLGAVLNAGLNVALVHGAGLGIAGSAIGTSLTQLGMAVWVAAVVAGGARREGARLRPDLAGILASGRSGVPLLVRTLALRAALLATTAVAVSAGTASLAAHQVAISIWNLLSLALDALAIAAQTLTGHALGAGDVQQVRAVTGRLLRWGVAAGAVLGVVLLAGRPWLVLPFADDPAVRSAFAAVAVVMALGEPLAGYVFVLDGVLIGAGDGRYLAWAGLAQLALYLPLAFLVEVTTSPGTAGLVWLWVAFAGGYMTFRAVWLGLRVRSRHWLVVGAGR
jgi:putative MATE family efflux protein